MVVIAGNLPDLTRSINFGLGRFVLSAGLSFRPDKLGEKGLYYSFNVGTSEEAGQEEIFNINKLKLISSQKGRFVESSYTNFAPNLAAIVYSSAALNQRIIGEELGACSTSNRGIEYTDFFGQIISSPLNALREEVISCLYKQNEILDAIDASKQFDQIDNNGRFERILDRLALDLVKQKFKQVPDIEGILRRVIDSKLRSEISIAAGIYESCPKPKTISEIFDKHHTCKADYWEVNGKSFSTNDERREFIFNEFVSGYVDRFGSGEEVWRFSKTLGLSDEVACEIIDEVWFNKVFFRAIRENLLKGKFSVTGELITVLDRPGLLEDLNKVLAETDKARCSNASEDYYVKIILFMRNAIRDNRNVVESIITKLDNSDFESHLDVTKFLGDFTDEERELIERFIFDLFEGEITEKIGTKGRVSILKLIETKLIPSLDLLNPESDTLRKFLLSVGHIMDKSIAGENIESELNTLQEYFSRIVEEINDATLALVYLTFQNQLEIYSSDYMIKEIDKARNSLPNDELTGISITKLYESHGAYHRAQNLIDEIITTYGERLPLRLWRAQINSKIDKSAAISEYKEIILNEEDILKKDYYEYLLSRISDAPSNAYCAKIGGLFVTRKDIDRYDYLHDLIGGIDSDINRKAPTLNFQIAMELLHQVDDYSILNDGIAKHWEELLNKEHHMNASTVESEAEDFVARINDIYINGELTDSPGVLYRVIRDQVMNQWEEFPKTEFIRMIELLEQKTNSTFEGVDLTWHEKCA